MMIMPDTIITGYDHTVETITQNLDSDSTTGLTEYEAQQRLQRYGHNVLQREQHQAWWRLLLLQLRNPLVVILIIAALLTAWLKEWADMIIILVVVVLNSSIGFWQEYRSSKILEKLQLLVRVHAQVKRDDTVKEVDAEQLVPGDIIMIKAGMKVPADARIITSQSLATNEAVLTGESVPVRKKNVVLSSSTALVDRVNMIYMGTTVERGEGSAMVMATANATELGRIAALTQRTKTALTPLQQRLRHLSRVISIFIVLSAVIIVVAGFLEGEPLFSIFTLAVAVAVAAIPEGLPAAVSVILAVAGQRIYKQQGLIKRLGAVETLGAVTVIATDKTGTLTEGVMKVTQVLNYGNINTTLQIAALANEALVDERDGGREISGDSTDKAKLEVFFKHGGNLHNLLKTKPKITALPFDAEKKYIAAFHQLSNHHVGIFVSGAPETILQSATMIATNQVSIRPLTQDQHHHLKKQYEQLAQEGHRMIALAYKEVSTNIQPTTELTQLTNHIQELVFFGFLALQDPIRSEVNVAMRTARQAGIQVIMITGDHQLTAQAIGKNLEFTIAPDSVIDGQALDKLSDAELLRRVQHIQIYARSNPEHKMRIVKAWQQHQAVVAMTGDGVNDAPAVKIADVGIALNAGTDVTKEAAELVLLNDSFATIIEAIKQGRVAFNNIRKVALFLLIGSFTELIIVMSSLLFQIPLPITAIQILWANLIEDGLPTFSLAFEPGGVNVMHRPPLSRQEPIVNRQGYVFIFFVGIVTDLILAGIFLWLYNVHDLSLEYIRTIIFATLSLDALIAIFALKSLHRPIYRIQLTNNPYLLVASAIGLLAIVLVIYLPLFNRYLETEPLLPQHVVLVLILALLDGIFIEVVKWFFRALTFSPRTL